MVFVAVFTMSIGLASAYFAAYHTQKAFHANKSKSAGLAVAFGLLAIANFILCSAGLIVMAITRM